MVKSSLTEARSRFARRLKAIRVPKGYRTARSFAQALDIDENRYTRYERGEVEPSLDLLLRICDLLGATPNDLLCDYIGTPPAAEVRAFAEDPARMDHSGMPAPAATAPYSATAASPPAADVAGRADAAAWLLASELAALRANTTGSADIDAAAPFKQLEATSEIFARLKNGPFAVFAGLAAELREHNASIETQQRIQALVDDLVRVLRHKTFEPA